MSSVHDMVLRIGQLQPPAATIFAALIAATVAMTVSLINNIFARQLAKETARRAYRLDLCKDLMKYVDKRPYKYRTLLEGVYFTYGDEKLQVQMENETKEMEQIVLTSQLSDDRRAGAVIRTFIQHDLDMLQELDRLVKIIVGVSNENTKFLSGDKVEAFNDDHLIPLSAESHNTKTAIETFVFGESLLQRILSAHNAWRSETIKDLQPPRV